MHEAMKLFKSAPAAAGATSIVAAFGRRKDIRSVKALVETVPLRKICNDAFFRAMVVACNKCEAFGYTLSQLDAIDSQSILLDRVTFGGLAHACIRRNDFRFVRRLAEKWNRQQTIADDWIPDYGSRLLRFCCGVRASTEQQDLVGERQHVVHRDFDAALEIFHLISRDSTPTASDYGWLIDACIKERQEEKALFLWDHMREVLQRNLNGKGLPFPGGTLFGFFTRLAVAAPKSGLATKLADFVDIMISTDSDERHGHTRLQIGVHSCSQLLKALISDPDAILGGCARALSLFFKLLASSLLVRCALFSLTGFYRKCSVVPSL